MATRRQPLIPGWLIPGVSAATLVVAVALAAFLALWWNASQGNWVAVWQDSYLWHVVRFSFWQAFLSALLSVVPAIFLARALYRRRFPGRLALLRLCAMTLILPVLVAVFGILSVYGRQGWLASLCQSLGLEWTFSPYGLQGILLAHVFFNLPMASRLLLRHWKTFPANNVSLPPSLGCAAGIFSASSNGRGYGDKSRRLPRLSLCSVSPASPPCYRWAAVRRQLLSSWLFIRR